MPVVQDERTRYFRRLRRLRNAARRWTVLAAGFAGTTAVIVPYQGIGAGDAVWAGLAGASTVMAWWRFVDARQLAAQPVPDPPDPAQAGDRLLAKVAQLPGGYPVAEAVRRHRTRAALHGSAAAGLWERLDRSARSMRELSAQIGGIDQEAVREAAGVERQLRDLVNQITSLEQASRLAPQEAQPSLQELRTLHLAQLEEGVTAYEQFVVAAAGFLSETRRMGGTRPPVGRLTEATEQLRGVTEGLADLRTRYGDLPTPS
jgi:hypothetical protein